MPKSRGRLDKFTKYVNDCMCTKTFFNFGGMFLTCWCSLQECTDPPYYALSGSDGKGVVPDMVEVLEHPDKVELLFFNGIMDMVSGLFELV